ncbi:NADPH-dependent diflavin oxidoreductase 1 [Entomortierella beljakovae]|nr:NADPH-dependent diflavin oxidoreductase 1 [Entomortierella beljakovae]
MIPASSSMKSNHPDSATVTTTATHPESVVNSNNEPSKDDIQVARAVVSEDAGSITKEHDTKPADNSEKQSKELINSNNRSDMENVSSSGDQGNAGSLERQSQDSKTHNGPNRGDGRSDSRRSRDYSSTAPAYDNTHKNDHVSVTRNQDRNSNGHRNDRHRSQQSNINSNNNNNRDHKDKSSNNDHGRRHHDNAERPNGGDRGGGRDGGRDKDGHSRGQGQRHKDDRQHSHASRQNNQGKDNLSKDHETKGRDSNQTDNQAGENARPDPLSLLSITGRLGLLAPQKAFFGNSRIVEDFEKLNKVGEGTYGVVYRARDKKTNGIVALKRIRMERENDGLPISSLREIKLLKTLRHDNIVLVKDVVVGSDLDQIFLVMEYCEQDMAALMDNVKKPYTPAEVKCLMYQLLKGIEYCHDHFVIHRDLKLSNLLLNSQGILKIADFGLARSFGLPSRPMTPKVVTLWYRAPELLFGDSDYTTAVDMWSVGCIFGELLKHAPLLPGKVEKQQVDLIIELLGTPHEKIWQGFNKLPMSSIKLPEQRFNNLRNKFPNITDAARSLLSGLLTYDPKKRLSVKQALAHPYFIEAPPAKHPSLLPTHPEVRNMSSSRNEENPKLKRQAGGGESESIGNNRKRMRPNFFFSLEIAEMSEATSTSGHVSAQINTEHVLQQQHIEEINPHQLDHITIHNPRRILFLYGSQTGCAQDVAENAAREARRMHFSASVSSMDDYDRSLLIRESFVVFIASTTGQGEEPDNMKKFWKFLLRKSHPSDALDHLEFTVFGMGDSSYIKFNWPAKKLYKRLLQLGATPFYEPGYADDQHYLGADGTLGPWLTGLWKVALEKYPVPPHLKIIPEDVIFQNSFSLSFDPKEVVMPGSQLNTNLAEPIQDFNSEPGTFLATLTKSTRITDPNHSQDVRHIELSIKDPIFPGYHPGDVLSLRPRNLESDVTEFLEYNGWTSIADDPFTIVENLSDHTLPKHIPHRQTLRSLLTNHLNVFSAPRTSFFQLLPHFTDNQDEKDKLREFVSPEGQDELYTYCHRVRRTIFEVMKDFKDVKVPLDYILDLFPFIMPRSFSIASAPLESVREQYQDQEQKAGVLHTSNGDVATGNTEGELEWKIDLCIAIVHYKTKLWKWRTGVCTRWLKSLYTEEEINKNGATEDNSTESTTEGKQEPSQFSIRIQRGTLKLPKNPNTPLICIGPGTGVAPMRSFLQHRIHAQEATENVLFFGCRKRKMDYHYREEWEGLERDGYIKVFAACSRDQEDKVYVQNLIEQQSPLVWELLHEKRGTILLSGSSNRMPTDVTRALQRVISSQGKMSIEQANDYLNRVEKEGRFQQECWS